MFTSFKYCERFANTRYIKSFMHVNRWTFNQQEKCVLKVSQADASVQRNIWWRQFKCPERTKCAPMPMISQNNKYYKRPQLPNRSYTHTHTHVQHTHARSCIQIYTHLPWALGISLRLLCRHYSYPDGIVAPIPCIRLEFVPPEIKIETKTVNGNPNKCEIMFIYICYL